MVLHESLTGIFKQRQASYKMVLILSLLEEIDDTGKASFKNVVNRFRSFYQQRTELGLPVEKPKSEMNDWEKMSFSQIRYLILDNPFNALSTILDKGDGPEEWIGFRSDIWSKMDELTLHELQYNADQALQEYYGELGPSISLRGYLNEIMTNYLEAKQQSFAGHPLGHLVRQTIPNALKQLPFLNHNYKIQGSVGQGNWAKIPWIAIMDKQVTETTQQGEYIVYLFSEDMQSVYLTLAQGVTAPINEKGRKEGYEYLKAKVQEMRNLLSLDNFQKDEQIYLTQGGIGQYYQVSTVAYVRYDRVHLPTDGQILSDLRILVENYRIYVEGSNPTGGSNAWVADFKYTMAYLHYIQGIVHYLGENESASLDELITNQSKVLKAGDEVKHPKERIQHIGRALQEFGLIEIQSNYYSLTSIGKRYYQEFGSEYWKFSDGQVSILREQIDSAESSLLKVILVAINIVKELAIFTVNQFGESFIGAIEKQNEWGSVTKENRSRFMLNWLQELQFIQKMGDSFMYVDSNVNNIFDQVQYIKDFIIKKGFTYPSYLIENFYLSLKTKPFVILAGISGTGKTKLVKFFAEAIGATEQNGQYTLIPVRPDWSDPSDLLGYIDLSGRFRPGILTEVLLEASKLENQDKPYFVCLDEMNLARVEHYFSDLLSIMETQRWEGDKIVTDKVMSIKALSEVDKDIYDEIRIPQNVYFIGTVNMDETTHPFSKKVLDRANTLEFNFIDLNNLPELTTVGSTHLVPYHLDQSFLKNDYLTLQDAYGLHTPLIQRTVDKLVKVNEILEGIHAHIGFRVRDTVCFYMIYNERFGLMKEEQAFDLQLTQKILPRIQGSSSAVKRTLLEFMNFTTNKKFNFEEMMTDASPLYESRKSTEEITDAIYPISARKIGFMLRRFEEDGFTSFWLS